MGIFRKTGAGLVWVWRRIADLSTLHWLWPGALGIVTLAVAWVEGLPVATRIVLALAAFVLTLAVVLLWRSYWGTRADEIAPASSNGPIRDRVSAFDAAAYMIFGSWDNNIAEIDSTERVALVHQKWRQMVQDASDGHLVICIRRQRHGGVWADPGKGFWEEHHIDWGSADGGSQIARPNLAGRYSGGFDPSVQKSDIERLYG